MLEDIFTCSFYPEKYKEVKAAVMNIIKTFSGGMF